MARSRAWLICVALAACGRIGFDARSDGGGGGGDDAGGSHSGSRLKLRWYEVDGHARQLLNFHDSLLDLDCDLEEWGGVTYCIPAWGFAVFEDAACTQAKVMVDTDDWYANWDWEGCAQPTLRIFHAGGALPGGSHYRWQAGMCMGPISDGSTFATAIEVPATSLVAATIETAAGSSGRLVRRDYVTDDGLRLETLPYDTQLATECLPAQFSDGHSACSPAEHLNTPYRSDGSCATPIALDFRTCSTQYANVLEPTSCTSGEELELRPIGAQLGLTTVDQETTAGCTTFSVPSFLIPYALGATVTAASLSHGPDDDLDHRIVQVHDDAGGKRFHSFRSLYDKTLASECSVSLSTDGMLRCLPHNLPITTNFTDATCSTGIQLAQTEVGCAPTAQFAGAPNGPGTMIYRLGAKHPSVWRMTGSCTQVTNTDFYDLGPQIDPSELAPAVIVVDP